jgi:hypothetical protein
LLVFAALLGSLMMTDHATSDRASDAMMHEMGILDAQDKHHLDFAMEPR